MRRLQSEVIYKNEYFYKYLSGPYLVSDNTEECIYRFVQVQKFID